MKRHLSIRPEAKTDIAQAFNWYRDRSEELGRMFLNELQRVLETIEERPLSYPRIHGEKRRALLHRFPYAVFYRLPADEVVVLGVFHQTRDSRRWKALR